MAWVDVERESREGLFNTNNYTEALLKHFNPTQKADDIANVLHQIVEVSLPYYEDLIVASETDDASIQVMDRTKTLVHKIQQSNIRFL